MVDLGNIERYILEYANHSRKERGIGSLNYDPNLHSIAKHHTETMAHAGKIWHGDGVHKAGGFSGENVAMVPSGGSSKDIAKRFHKCWMSSPGHKENILRSEFGSLGVGVVQKGNYYYSTQLFKGGSFFGFGGPSLLISPKIWKKILNFLLWWLTFALGIFIVNLLIPFVKIPNNFLVPLFFGLIIETVSKLSQIIRFKTKFVINKTFGLWIFIQSFLYIIATNLLGNTNLFYLSLLITIFVYGIWELGGEKYRGIKDFIVWFIIFSIGVVLANALLSFIRLKNPFLILLFIGFIIETTSKLIQYLRYESKFIVDKWYVFWILVITFCYYIASFLMKTVSVQGQFWSSFISTIMKIFSFDNNIWGFIISGFIITILVHGIWKLKFYKKYFIITLIILILLLLYLTLGPDFMNLLNF